MLRMGIICWGRSYSIAVEKTEGGNENPLQRQAGPAERECCKEQSDDTGRKRVNNCRQRDRVKSWEKYTGRRKRRATQSTVVHKPWSVSLY